MIFLDFLGFTGASCWCRSYALVGRSNTEVSYGLHQSKTMILSLSQHYLARSLSAVHSFPLSQGPMFVKGGSI